MPAFRAGGRLSRSFERPHAQRTRAADRVFEQLERDGVAHLEIVEDAAFLHVATMKVNLAAVTQADVSVPLAHHDLGNSAGGRCATRRVRPRRLPGPRRRAPDG